MDWAEGRPARLPSHPHHRFVARLAHRFAWDPEFQFKVHLFATGVWAVNFAVATLVFFLAQGFWKQFATYYLVMVSLYANFATDYDAVSASLSAIHAQAARRKVEER